MCSRTDCYGSWAGPLACSVCRERDMSEMKITARMLCALAALADIHCDRSVYWEKGTLDDLQHIGFAKRNEDAMCFWWEITEQGKQYLQQEGVLQ